MRFLAALLVVEEHVGAILVPRLQNHTLGLEAVVAFFVLSGFVISFVTAEKETTLRGYAFARASRMYTVVPLAILATVTADLVGRHFAPLWYVQHSPEPFHLIWGWHDLAKYISFTNEMWRTHNVVGSDEPYWSLGFEVPYYILFGLVTFARRRVVKAIAGIAWLALYGPKIALFLPVWLVGVATYRAVRGGPKLPTAVASATVLITIVLATFLIRSFSTGMTSMFLWSGMTAEVRLAAYDYSLAVLLGCHIVAFNSLPEGVGQFGDRIERSIRWLAGGSFTIYIMHQPILMCLSAIVGAPYANARWKLLVIAAVLVCCYLLAELGERRKKQLTKLARSYI